MAKVYGLDGKELGQPERIEPKMLLDAADGLFSIPVVVLSDFQFNALVDTIVERLKAPVVGQPPNPEPVEGEVQIPLDGVFQTV